MDINEHPPSWCLESLVIFNNLRAVCNFFALGGYSDVNEKTREKLILYTKVLDRVLLHNHYVIPHWHIKIWRVAYWSTIKRPKNLPKYSLGFPETWWYNK